MSVQVSNSRITVMAPHGERCLAAQSVERLDGICPGEGIVCTDGVLWVTLEGDPEDYVLIEGEMFVADRPGMLLMQALNEPACWRYVG